MKPDLPRVGRSFSAPSSRRQRFGATKLRPHRALLTISACHLLLQPRAAGIRELIQLRPHRALLTISACHLLLQPRAAGIRELILKPTTVDELDRVLDRIFRDGELNANQPRTPEL
ncbi:MAG: hypothetical protein HYU73_06025 [Betaproteobacteria bacterium]|nr:hypothetical protein [Betaproteobacteria bacterium]